MTKVDETEELNWIKYQGDSLTLSLLWEDENGSPVDITDYTIRFQIGPTGGTNINESTSGTVETNGGAAGTVDIFVPDDVMATLPVGDYDWAVELYKSSTKTRRTLFSGVLTLEEDLRV